MIEIDGYTKDAICQYFNVHYPQFPDAKAKDIVSVRVEDGDIIALIDCGIKGIPKVTIPAEKLEFMPKPEVKFPATHGGDKIISPKLAPEVKPKHSPNGRRKRGAKK